ncbi:hypothetical protein D6779_04975, partial [Candidatus Parcubacteria bacterium]
MKHVFCLRVLIWALIAVIWVGNIDSYAQPRITPRLQNRLTSGREGDFLPVIAVLHDQVDIAGLDQQLKISHASLAQRHRLIVEALQEKAESTQPDLLMFLEKLKNEGKVRSFRSFWIINAIALEAVPEVITQLARLPGIAYIDVDALLKLDKPVSRMSAPESQNSAEPGLKVINAHKLWQRGITGQGVIVMNIDTGVDGDHPALASRWRGNQPGVSASAAWFDPNFGSSNPQDNNGHGTHTMGIMCGLNGANNDTIGVAFGAQWIAARTLNANPHTCASVAAFQWAADPDGDPNTVDDVPAVINCSWTDTSVTNECSTSNPYYPVIANVEALGTAVVFSAGNNGPSPQTITAPKNGIFSPVNIWATGAIDGNIPGYPIAPFSSRGPSSCDGITIKPEACAPGVDVRSSYRGGGYAFLSGTSMASPHVAGAIALLRQAFPNKTGSELKEVLLATAVDLGPQGEDNDYGMGLIDVEAAYLFLKNIDVVVDQQLSNGTSVDSVGRWEGGPKFEQYVVPHTFTFEVGTTEVLRGAQKIISNEKYYKWSLDDTVSNHREFHITDEFPAQLISKFHPTKPGIVLKNAFLSAPPGTDPGNDVIAFKDPWLIDYPDPQYGNNKRNQGMAAPFKSRPAPFNPDY